MNLTVLIESFLNALDFGAFVESLRNYRNRAWNINPGEIIKHIITGRGYVHLTPPQLSRMITRQAPGLHIIDLRESHKYREKHITHAVLKPIDDFLKEIYAGKYSPTPFPQKIILVCDTGQMSRFAAAVLAGEAGARVYSLAGGMRRWNRWERLSRRTFFTRHANTGVPGEVKCCG